MMTTSRVIALTGATGYVGGHLLTALLRDGHDVRCLVRTPAKADLDAQARVVQGNVVTGEGLDELLAGADVAYYLVHSMGSGASAEEFAERDRRAARTFGAAAQRAGVSRIVYLGGLEDGATGSEHLRSRHEVATLMREAAARRSTSSTPARRWSSAAAAPRSRSCATSSSGCR